MRSGLVAPSRDCLREAYKIDPELKQTKHRIGYDYIAALGELSHGKGPRYKTLLTTSDWLPSSSVFL
jgi:hypothetical protein